MFDTEVYRNRRQCLKELSLEGILLFVGNSFSSKDSSTVASGFLQDTNFLYFWGVSSPNLAALIDLDSGEEIFFGDDKGINECIWDVTRPRVAQYAARAGTGLVRSLTELEVLIDAQQKKGRKVHCLPSSSLGQDIWLRQILNLYDLRMPVSFSTEFARAVISLREIKSGQEVAEIESAVDLTATMILAAASMIRPGKSELEVVTASECAVRGKTSLAFPAILTSKGCYLHCGSHDFVMQEDDLIVQDCGARSSNYYCADITRTFPVAGKFSGRQREIYEAVRGAQEVALGHMRPGVSFKETHRRACLYLCNCLKDLRVMKGDAETAVELGAHALFFPCGLGHPLGLDVHDMSSISEDMAGYGDDFSRSTQFGLDRLRFGKKLKEGMVLTVEPGLYFNPELTQYWRDQRLHTDYINYETAEEFFTVSGIRLEDDVVVESNGCRVLGKPIAKTIDEVEGLFAS